MRAHLIITIAALGCSKPAAPPDCEAIALASTAARQLIDEAILQRASAARAMDIRARWDRGEVPAAQDGTGEYSHADERARAYRDVAMGMCQAANTAIWQLHGLTQRARDPEVAREGRRLDLIGLLNCSAGYVDSTSSDEARRTDALDAWRRALSTTRDAVGDLVRACHETLRIPPSTSMPSEAP